MSGTASTTAHGVKTSATNTTPVANRQYWAEVQIERSKTLTGVGLLNGATVGTDKTVDSATLLLTATNLNPDNPVVVAISAASSLNPNVFGEITSGLRLDPGETRTVRVSQTDSDDPLVTATQSESVNIRFDSRSPKPGIGELEFRFTIHVLAHKETPGTGAGTLLFY